MKLVAVLFAASLAAYLQLEVGASHRQNASTKPQVVQQSPSPTPTPKPTPKPKPKPKVATPKPAPKVATPTPTAPKEVAAAPKPKPKNTLPAPSSKVKSLKPKPKSGGGSGLPPPNPSQPVSYESTNWAGYFASSKTYSSVSGSWIVPNPAGDGINTTADATWIGIGGVNSNDLIQTGTYNIVGSDGTVSSQAFYEMLPDAAITIPDIDVTPGDSMSASVSKISLGMWNIDITDNTDNETFSITTAYDSSLSTAEWIEEDPSDGNNQLIPFDNFGTATFSGASTTANGVVKSLSAAAPDSITLVDSSYKPLATPSSISGSGFTVTHN